MRLMLLFIGLSIMELAGNIPAGPTWAIIAIILYAVVFDVVEAFRR